MSISGITSDLMELIITEKPSVALKMAYALASDQRAIQKLHHGRAIYYKIQRNGKEIFIAPAVGHLYSLKEKKAAGKVEKKLTSSAPTAPGAPGQPNATKSIWIYEYKLPVFDLEWRPAYEINKAAWYMKAYLDSLADLAAKAEKTIIATDYDLEGDLIGANIVRHFGNLERSRRMRFSTLAPGELQYAFENTEDINIFNVRAAETRHMIDWIYGINLSRAVMHALRAAGRAKILSIGRVQGPFLKYLVERQRDIAAFIPQDFWELNAFASRVRFQHETSRFFSEAEAAKAQSQTPTEGVIEITHERKSIYPPPAFDFTSLQVEAYRHFGISPVQTQEIAQSLYTNAYISYPRTSSQKLPRQLNLPGIIAKISKNSKYSDRASKLLQNNMFRPREGNKEDVHPAIHPTGIIGKLSADEERLYDLIVSRFLACFMEPAEIEDAQIAIIAGNQRYKTDARSITKLGWLDGYKYSNIKQTEFPPFQTGQKVRIEKFEILKKQTSPPPRFSPATILQTLEDQEVGTKTTRALVLDILYKRGYLSGRQINVTPLGIAVYDAFNKYVPLVVDPELTRKLEKEIEAIQEDKMSQDEVINDAKQIITDVVAEMKNKEKEIGSELLAQLKKSEEFAPCKCGGKLRVLQKGRSKFLGCTNYPKCKITYSLPYYLFNYAEQCPECNSPVIWIIKGKQRFKACLNRECPSKLEKEAAREKREKEKVKIEKIEKIEKKEGKKAEKAAKQIKKKKKAKTVKKTKTKKEIKKEQKPKIDKKEK